MSFVMIPELEKEALRAIAESEMHEDTIVGHFIYISALSTYLRKGQISRAMTRLEEQGLVKRDKDNEKVAITQKGFDSV